MIYRGPTAAYAVKNVANFDLAQTQTLDQSNFHFVGLHPESTRESNYSVENQVKKCKKHANFHDLFPFIAKNRYAAECLLIVQFCFEVSSLDM